MAVLVIAGGRFGWAAAGSQDPAPLAEESRPVTFYVGGVSCPSCAVPVREGIAHVPGVQQIDLSVEEKFLRFRFDARKTSIQALMKSFIGEEERFPSRLVLQLEDPKAEAEAVERARTALSSVAGVRAMSLPDAEGVVLVTFHLDKNTLLLDVLGAAAKAGLPLRDPPAKKPAK